MNIWKPSLNADITLLVWAPWNVASPYYIFQSKRPWLALIKTILKIISGQYHDGRK
jgi:hypothetical protein